MQKAKIKVELIKLHLQLFQTYLKQITGYAKSFVDMSLKPTEQFHTFTDVLQEGTS